MTGPRIPTDVRRWRDALVDADLPIATCGVLLQLAQWMNADGTNAYPSRARLAAHCAVSESSIDRHLAKAAAAGYLERTAPGHTGQNAVYRATIPTHQWDAETETLIRAKWDEGKLVWPIDAQQSAAPVTRSEARARQTQAKSASPVTRLPRSTLPRRTRPHTNLRRLAPTD